MWAVDQALGVFAVAATRTKGLLSELSWLELSMIDFIVFGCVSFCVALNQHNENSLDLIDVYHSADQVFCLDSDSLSSRKPTGTEEPTACRLQEWIP